MDSHSDRGQIDSLAAPLVRPHDSQQLAQGHDGELVVRMLEDAGADAGAAIDAEVARLRAALGELRVTPRFRTPLERELSG